MSAKPSAAPVDNATTIAALIVDPYPIYKQLRREAPVARVTSVGRTFLTKAADTKYVKDNPALFSSDDQKTPQRRAFQAHTLMRKDGPEHRRERMAMAPAFGQKVIQDVWVPSYRAIAEEYVGRLPKGETVDLFDALAGPYAGRGLAVVLGIEDASDAEMMRWSQDLINGAGNFGWLPEPFEKSDAANCEMDACFTGMVARHRANPGPSALSVMVNAADPIPTSQIFANIKICIGGGLNEPRDSLLTVLCGLLTNPEQLAEVKRTGNWSGAFEEAIRWCAPVQASSRVVVEDTEIRGCFIPKGEIVMPIQASANHDEDIYDHPERFDIFRKKQPHQAFGNGPHFCLGMGLARRVVADVMLPVLFDRFPNLSLPDPGAVVWRGFGFRGPVCLPVKLA